ncbi:MAG: hypothetical protein HQM14_02695 [SAR324 cluster bacterium]|nr:hypothetical protein [SAR324 cluster bacterium]
MHHKKKYRDISFLAASALLIIFITVKLKELNAAPQAPIWVTAAGDLRGEIKPCGCSADGDLGGLLRRATYLEQLRQSEPSAMYLDLGNNFPLPSEQGRLKVELLQKSLQELKPSSILVGPNELLYERPLLDYSLPYLLTNTSESWPVKTLHIEKLAEKKIGIWGYLSPEQVYQNENDEPWVYPVNDQVLQAWKQERKKHQVDYTILLFRGNEQELETFEHSHLFDMIITGNNNDDELHQILEMKTKTSIFSSVPTKGQGTLEGQINFSGKAVHFEVQWLRDTYQDHPDILPIFNAYEQQVKELFFTNLDRMEQHQQDSPYAGATKCKECHLDAYNTWSQSRHAQAFSTLEKVNKHFDLECLQCHVVGLNQKGFLSPELTSSLLNVQCENCHGASKAHVSDPPKKRTPNKPAMQACVSCHKGSHSPAFDFSKYWLKIIHQ